MDAAALDRGQLFAASILTTDGKLYGNLYDGKHWSKEPVLIADEVTRIAGDDRRLSLEFDPSRTLARRELTVEPAWWPVMNPPWLS